MSELVALLSMVYNVLLYLLGMLSFIAGLLVVWMITNRWGA